MRRPSLLGSNGPPRQAGAWRHAACRRRGAPASVVSASLPVFFLALPLLGASCAGGLLGNDSDTGLDLQVTRSPIDPVEREGEPNFAPVAEAVVEVRREGGGSARTMTDADGRVRLLLDPGRYAVEVEECPGALSLPRPAEATVEPGAFTPLRLDCDTGIR